MKATANVEPGRNDPCPCGSGKKYKKCCGQDGLEASAVRTGQPRADTLTPAETGLLAGMIHAGRFVELESAARDLVDRHPNSGFAWKVLGVSLKTQGKDALHALQKAVTLLPDDAEARSNLGNALRDHGQLEEAAACYRRALEIKPDYAGAYNNLGNVLLDLGRPDDAVTSYRRALEIKPDYAEAYNNLGIVLRLQSRAAEAAASCRQALEFKPDYAAAHSSLGNALLDLGQLADAAASYRRALALSPDFAEAHSNLGNALRGLGEFDQAAAHYRRALEIQPEYAATHSNLGNVLQDLGRLDEAAASYRRALDIKPDYAQAHNNLANALRGLGRLDEAAASCRRALDIEPQYAEAHVNLGVVLRDSGRLVEAAASYRRALEIKPDLAEAHSNLGIVQRVQGRIAEAQASCRRALAINPNAASATVFLAELHADEGEFAEAEALFKRAISVDPDSPQAWAGIARLRKMTDGDAAWLAEAQRIAGLPLPPRPEAYLRYAIGKYFDDVKSYEQAFLNFQRANELTKRYGVKHDRQQLTQAVDRMTRFYDRAWINQARIDANPSQRPIFIVGMPRSGTTLAEQILASHPKVAGVGELPFWNDAAAAYKTTAPDGGTNGGMISKLAEDYLRLLAELAPDALRVIDKMPANFLFLGLIHAALPNARILHMRRNPIYTCLSIYFQHFEVAYSYASDLEDLAHYYTEYSRVMEHWRSTLPENAILDVSYEGLVEDQEAWSRKMLEFIGLPWDPICLEFHRTDRTVITASKWQVRQKISKSSVGRWRNYEKFVGPLLPLMESEAR